MRCLHRIQPIILGVRIFTCGAFASFGGHEAGDFVIVMIDGECANAVDKLFRITNSIGPVRRQGDRYGLSFAALPADLQAHRPSAPAPSRP